MLCSAAFTTSQEKQKIPCLLKIKTNLTIMLFKFLFQKIPLCMLD